MGLFSKNEKTVWVEVVKYHLVNDEIYRVEMNAQILKSESELPETELLNKYGFYICKYNIEFNNFAEWDEHYFKNMSDVEVDLNDSNEISEEDLDNAINDLKAEIKKKFDDFELNGTLYTRKGFGEYDQHFNEIVRPVSKLVNTKWKSITHALLLEVEVLDGRTADITREFIPFAKFIYQYEPGYNIQVVDSTYISQVSDYFDVAY